MKRSEPLAVGDILQAMIESDGDTAEFDRQKACFLWSEIAGPTINHATTRRYVDGDVLHVYISSGPLKSELAYMVPGFVEKINEALGRRIIKKIAVH